MFQNNNKGFNSCLFNASYFYVLVCKLFFLCIYKNLLMYLILELNWLQIINLAGVAKAYEVCYETSYTTYYCDDGQECCNGNTACW